MAPLKDDRGVVLRARMIRASASAARREAREARAASRRSRVLRRQISDDLARQVERREAATAGLGTWPYWAVDLSELRDVLVSVPDQV
jgi:hypothetical protein